MKPKVVLYLVVVLRRVCEELGNNPLLESRQLI